MDPRKDYLHMDRLRSTFDNPRKSLLLMARTAEQAERHEHMLRFCRELILAIGSQPVTVDERNVIAIGLTKVISKRRASLRSTREGGVEGVKPPMIKEYRAQLKREIHDLCIDAIQLLESHLLQHNPQLDESRVFFLKLTGDQYRYLAEISPNQNYGHKAVTYYEQGVELARSMPPTHPVRLSLALNYSVCNYEILDKRKEARELAKRAFDKAISKLDNLDEADYRDSTLIMQLLRDNLTLWTAEGRE